MEKEANLKGKVVFLARHGIKHKTKNSHWNVIFFGNTNLK